MERYVPSSPARHPQPNQLTDSLSRLSITQTPTKTTLPPSFPAQNYKNLHLESPASLRNVSSPAANTQRPSPSLLRRSASSMSIDRRCSSPALNRRTSTSSMRNGLDSPSSSNSPRLLNKRSSSNMLLSQLMPSVEEPAPPTAESLAAEFFERELASHTGNGPIKEKTVVIIHDDCYGHRFSRLKTKDSILSIFERPERVQASVMGISAAYVRLGERFTGGKCAPGPKTQPSRDLPFRIIKSSRKIKLHSDAVTAVHGKEWMKELQGLCERAEQKVASATIELERTPNSNGTKKDTFHSGDLYLCGESINALEGALGGVCDAVDAVFQGSATGTGPTQAFACVRPPGHHCSSDWPSGFCWLNNVHVGVQHAIQSHGLTHAAIIDFDLHHGDGSQEITWAHNERMQFPKSKNFPNSKKSFLGYFSLHDINSFPCELGDREKTQMASLCIDNAHGQAIWNVHLEQWQKPEEFWNLYETRYKVILDKVRKFLKHRTNEVRLMKNGPAPKAAIFISAGFDASEHEVSYMQRHSVNVMTEFYARFTHDIVELANEEGTAVGGRVISVLEGGYSDKALVSGVLSHISGFCDGSALSQDAATSTDIADGLANLGISGLAAAPVIGSRDIMRYDNDWWDNASLDHLVQLLHPPETASEKAAVKKSRSGTYSSPTHSSVMKAVDPNKVMIRASSISSSIAPSRAASPPLPDVDWATATSELYKLLIPKDRQINSLTQSDLNPTKEARIKKEVPTDVATAMIPNGRALRERRPRTSVGPEVQPAAVRSRKDSIDRRKTIADVPLPSVEISMQSKEPRRRTSIASTISASSTVPAARARPQKPAETTVEVKKSRPSTSTSSSSRASSVKPPVPRVLSGTKRQVSAPGAPEPALGSTGDSAMDGLTSGLQRITIKVPSNEEYVARQAKPASIAASRGSTAIKKPVVSRGAKTVTVTGTAAKKPAVRTVAPKVTVNTLPKAFPMSENQPLPVVEPPQAAPMPSQPALTSPTLQPAQQGLSSPISSMSPVTPQPYPNLQWATPNADVTKEPVHNIVSNQYQTGFQWMPPNSDAPIATTYKGASSAQPRVAEEAHQQQQQQQTVPQTFSATGYIPFADSPPHSPRKPNST